MIPWGMVEGTEGTIEGWGWGWAVGKAYCAELTMAELGESCSEHETA